jgi:hypothetical protein
MASIHLQHSQFPFNTGSEFRQSGQNYITIKFILGVTWAYVP